MHSRCKPASVGTLTGGFSGVAITGDDPGVVNPLVVVVIADAGGFRLKPERLKGGGVAGAEVTVVKGLPFNAFRSMGGGIASGVDSFTLLLSGSGPDDDGSLSLPFPLSAATGRLKVLPKKLEGALGPATELGAWPSIGD